MKKSTIFILLVLAAMILGVVASASAESKDQYYASIQNALVKLEVALDAGNKSNAEAALAEVRTQTYAGMRFLATIGAYDGRAMSIINYASGAMTADNYKWYIAQAGAMNWLVFGTDLRDTNPPEESLHS